MEEALRLHLQAFPRLTSVLSAYLQDDDDRAWAQDRPQISQSPQWVREDIGVTSRSRMEIDDEMGANSGIPQGAPKGHHPWSLDEIEDSKDPMLAPRKQYPWHGSGSVPVPPAWEECCYRRNFVIQGSLLIDQQPPLRELEGNSESKCIDFTSRDTDSLPSIQCSDDSTVAVGRKWRTLPLERSRRNKIDQTRAFLPFDSSKLHRLRNNLSSAPSRPTLPWSTSSSSSSLLPLDLKDEQSPRGTALNLQSREISNPRYAGSTLDLPEDRFHTWPSIDPPRRPRLPIEWREQKARQITYSNVSFVGKEGTNIELTSWTDRKRGGMSTSRMSWSSDDSEGEEAISSRLQRATRRLVRRVTGPEQCLDI